MKQVDYKNGKIFSNVMQSVLPMLVAQVLSLLYSIVDRIYIGRIPGEGTSVAHLHFHFADCFRRFFRACVLLGLHDQVHDDPAYE